MAAPWKKQLHDRRTGRDGRQTRWEIHSDAWPSDVARRNVVFSWNIAETLHGTWDPFSPRGLVWRMRSCRGKRKSTRSAAKKKTPEPRGGDGHRHPENAQSMVLGRRTLECCSDDSVSHEFFFCAVCFARESSEATANPQLWKLVKKSSKLPEMVRHPHSAMRRWEARNVPCEAWMNSSEWRGCAWKQSATHALSKQALCGDVRFDAPASSTTDSADVLLDEQRFTVNVMLEPAASNVLRYWVVPFGSEQERVGHWHVETTNLVTCSIACCLLVYFTTGGLIADWLPRSLTIRNFHLLWYRLLISVYGCSTIDYATTCVFGDFGASPFDCTLFRYESIWPLLEGHFVFVVLFVRFAAVGVVTVSVLLAVCRNINSRLPAKR